MKKLMLVMGMLAFAFCGSALAERELPRTQGDLVDYDPMGV